jgi:ribonuclease HII
MPSKSKNTPLTPLQIWHTKNRLEAGVDEAGRGSFIGDLYVASVIWSHAKSDYDHKSSLFSEIKDSKKLTAKKREELAEYIKENAFSYSITSVSPEDIEKHNILQATYRGMHKAIRTLDVIPEFLLIDGDKFKPYIDAKFGHIPHATIPQGDNKYVSIAAASILAKTAHDQHIRQLVETNPELEKYNLLSNMGYGTKQHREAITEHGITPYHRKQFCAKYIHTKEEIITDKIKESEKS